MKKTFSSIAGTAAFFLIVLAACTKTDQLIPPVPQPGSSDTTATQHPPKAEPPTEQLIAVRMKAFVQVGEVMYDSIPATITLTSWDSANVSHDSSIQLTPGTNVVNLRKKYTRHRFTMNAWGVEQTLEYTREQLREGLAIALGSKREPKLLRSAASFLLIQGEYRPQSKTDYYYNVNGTLSKIEYQQKKPQSADLKKFWTDRFFYNGTQVTKINRHDDQDKAVIFTDFTYDANGFVQNIHQDSYGNETYAYVQRGVDTEHDIIDVDFLFDNGQAMAYTMKFKDGNMVADNGLSSTGAAEGGTYTYDHNINPYHQMNWPDMYFRNHSKNNRTVQNKGYGGNIPSSVPYKTVYTYDADGYPSQVVKSYKSYATGEHLYDEKTEYIY